MSEPGLGAARGPSFRISQRQKIITKHEKQLGFLYVSLTCRYADRDSHLSQSFQFFSKAVKCGRLGFCILKMLVWLAFISSLACFGSLLSAGAAHAKSSESVPKLVGVDALFSTQGIDTARTEKNHYKLIPSDPEILAQFMTVSRPEISVLAADVKPNAEPPVQALTSEGSWSLFNATDDSATAPQISQANAADSSAWRLQLSPNVYIPVDDGGPDFSDSINYSLYWEAWNVDNNVKLFFEANYREVGLTRTVLRSVPPQLQTVLPSAFESALDSQLLTLDVGLGYRFYDRRLSSSTDRSTAFDLPPFSFDLMAGARVFLTWSDLDITSNLGQTSTFTRQKNWVEPLVGARLRWNTSDQVALLIDGRVSGFGIGPLSLSWTAKGALDWRVSGNTSLMVGYQVLALEGDIWYGSGNLRFDNLSHGPYAGLVLRF